LLLAETGPDHSKTFEVCASIGNRRFSPARGANKKVAEQRAAGNAMADLSESPLPFPITDDSGATPAETRPR
jgi:ribonuclease-3